MNWLSLLVGILIGWLVEWLIDFFYWRRKYSTVAKAETQTRAQLIDLQTQAGEADALRADLSAAQAQIGSLQAALTGAAEAETQTRAQLADLQTRAGQVDQLNIDLTAARGEADALRGDLSAAQAEIGGLQASLAAAVAAAAAAERAARDDLTVIEGIGPKIAELLNQQGIRTYDELANTDVDRLREVLKAGGPGFQLADPTSWPRQARLAAKRDWQGLAALKAQLTGGVRMPVVEKPQPDDDLTRIEGIGPKIDALLKEHGIRTFTQLAKAEPDGLRAILSEAGPGFQAAPVESWPEQARLAADHAWDELRVLQERLTGGRQGA